MNCSFINNNFNYYETTLLYFSTIIILIFSNCQREPLAPFEPKNHLAEFTAEKPQFFDLDTISFQEIIGKHGTKIYFERDNFNLKTNQKVQLELVELYDFKEVLYRNIQTVTVDDKLLESSGVLKVKFTSNGDEIQLKKGKRLVVYPPKEKLKDNDIFLSETDSIGNIQWRITDQNSITCLITNYGGIEIQRMIPKDSLTYYTKQNKTYDEIISQTKIANDYFILESINGFNWINIDRVVNPSSNINFELVDNKKEFSGFNTYIIYENQNSFLHQPLLADQLFFYEIPLAGKVNLTVIGENKTGIFYDKIELKDILNNSKIVLEMKKTSKDELKTLFNK